VRERTLLKMTPRLCEEFVNVVRFEQKDMVSNDLFIVVFFTGIF